MTSLDAGVYKTEPFAISLESRRISRRCNPSVISSAAEFADLIAGFRRSQLTSSESPSLCSRIPKPMDVAVADAGVCRIAPGTLRKYIHVHVRAPTRRNATAAAIRDLALASIHDLVAAQGRPRLP